MFCYGKGNKIDFTKLNGTVGVVAPNHSGKSALMDAISYSIYDMCSRTNKALDVMNKKKTTFRSKLNLEINGNDYWIERDAKYHKRNHNDGTISHMCPVKVRFYMVDDSGEEVDLSGAARFNSQYGGGTNEEIRKVLGTFDDFILTSLSLQTNGMNFIDKKQSERKKVLSTFMDIDIFEQLETIAKSDSNDERVSLKRFQKKDSYRELGLTENKIIDLEEKEDNLNKQDQALMKQITDLEGNKLELVRGLYKIDDPYDIDELHKQLEEFLTEQKQLEKQVELDKEYSETLRPMYNEYHEKLAEIDEEKIQEDYDNYKELKSSLRDTESNIKILESTIKSLKSHLKDLGKFKYDEYCEYCLKNGEEQIQEQEHHQNKLQELESQHQAAMGMHTIHKHNFGKVEDAEENKEEFARFQDELTQVSHDAVKIGGKIAQMEARLEHLETEISNNEERIELYYKSEEKIESNHKLNKQISDITQQLSKLQMDNIEVDTKYKQVLSYLSVAKNQKQNIEKDIQELIDIEQKILDYDLYLLALSKDGIPYELIARAIPSIQREINHVLDNMMSGFHIELEMEDKNIDAFICYGEDRWNLELSSGMERFVSSLAIRIGLINVSTLPRPNFIIVDEGFGTLGS
jgi:DNA repair exonuclease SbcCD ATPase subunit